MHVALLWALWVLPYKGSAHTAAYFATNTECLRVATVLIKQHTDADRFVCVQAEYIIPEGVPNAILKSK